ncbi:MAG: acetylornithine deacetylase [Solirubrobacteraceae bacterium]|jgi:acetylornithine deacetylase|nr:acetylornithine deacetylase [Solirubrobacteraceae bacterium]
MDQTVAQIGAKLDRRIAADAEWAFALLERLVAQASLLGAEAGAQGVLAEACEELGFGVEWLPIPEDIGEDPAAGVPSGLYAGRSTLVARLPGTRPGQARSLLVNGHLDVVPAGDADAWAHPPFTPTRVGGWLVGRGAGDMKGGWAMALLAIAAMLSVGRPAGDLTLVGAIEEECTGNGTLASVRAGVGADAVVLPEPTDLDLLVSGLGVLWVDVLVRGRPAHAEVASDGIDPTEVAWSIVRGLRAMAAGWDDAAADGARHHVNVGTFAAGEWPSSVPARARLGVRIGFPADWTPVQAEDAVRAAVTRASGDDPWLLEHPPVVRLSGFRAEGYALDGGAPLLDALAGAHEDAHGSRPRVVGTNGTTDARFYLNQAGTPAVCFGPRMRGMHAMDEAVELQSIVDGARTLARFMTGWLQSDRAAA